MKINLRALKFTSSIAYFGMPMGLLGLSLNAKHYQSMLGWDSMLSDVLMGLGWLSLLVISLAYLKHFMSSKTRDTLIAEWQDAFKVTLFPVVTLTLLLFVGTLNVLKFDQAWVFWLFILVGTIHTLLSIKLINRWLFDHRLEITHLKPTWFIVLSGNFYLVILASSIFQHTGATYEFLWFYFSYSLLMWLVLATILFYRLFFEEALSSQLRPSLFIFMAPPSLGAMAALQLFGSINGVIPLVAWVFYSFATIMLFLWILAFAYFKQAHITMGAWAFVYPLAAYGLMNQYFAQINPHPFFWMMSAVIFLITLAFVALLFTWLVKQVFMNASRGLDK